MAGMMAEKTFAKQEVKGLCFRQPAELEAEQPLVWSGHAERVPELKRTQRQG